MGPQSDTSLAAKPSQFITQRIVISNLANEPVKVRWKVVYTANANDGKRQITEGGESLM